MRSPKDTVFDDSDPTTETVSSGRSITRLEDEYDPETEINPSGRSILRLEEEYDPETETSSSGRSVTKIENEPDTDTVPVATGVPPLVDTKTQDLDPLSSFEKEAPDFTGVCVSITDASMAIDDPETEINPSGRSILRLEEEDDPETEINPSGRSVLLAENDGGNA